MARARSLRQLTWEKSQGICFLCGLQMFPDLAPPDPLAYTVEHMVPRSRGGANELSNLEGTHQFCNNWKSDESIEDLPTGYKKFLRWKIKNLIRHRKV